MKKALIKVLCAISVVALLVSTSVFTSLAADKTTIYFSNSKLNVGDTVTVTVKIVSDEPFYAVDGIFVYDTNVLSLNADMPKFVEAASGTAFTKSVTFTAIAEGNASIGVDSVRIVPSSDIPKTVSGASASVSVVSASANTSGTSVSSNCDLASIVAGAGTLTPAFSSSVTSYTVTVPNKVTDGTLSWKVKDASAKAAVSGNRQLAVGSTVRKITVTAKDGTQKVYTVNFIRLDENGNNIEENNTSSVPELPVSTEKVNVTENGINYYLTDDFTNVVIPDGLTAAVFTYNDDEHIAYTGENGKDYFVFLTTEDGTSTNLFKYSGGHFTKITYTEILGIPYVLYEFPKDVIIPENYESVVYAFGAYSETGVSKSNDLRYVIFYAESPSGEIGYYRYDKTEKTMQRYDDFSELLKQNSEEQLKKETVIGKISSLGTVNLSVVIAIVLAAIILIAIIVLIIILSAKNKKEKLSEDIDGFDVELTEDTPKDLQEMLDETFSDDN